MIPFQSQLISALVGALLASWGTAHYLNQKHELELAKIKEASQVIKEQAQQKVQDKTEAANTITVNNTAQLQKELLDAKDKINTLQRGIANGTIGMRVNVLANSCSNAGVQSATDSKPVSEVVSAELDPKTANDLIDITATGDEYARKYNGLYAWCEAQIKNQNK